MDFYNKEIAKEIIKYRKIVDTAMDYSKLAGQKHHSIDTVISKAEYSFQNSLDGLTSLKENRILRKINEIQQAIPVEDAKAKEWVKTYGRDLEITNLEESKDLMKFHWLDIVIWLFFIIEAYIGYNLLLDYFGDPTIENMLKSALTASVIMLITFAVKKFSHYLPRQTKFAIAAVFFLASTSFIYIISDMRKQDGVALSLESSDVSSNLSVEDESSTDYRFNLSLLLTLMFGGLTISMGLRDPKKEYAAKKIIGIYSNIEVLKRNLSAYNFDNNEADQEINKLKKKGIIGIKIEALSRYLEGINQNRSHSFRSQETEQIAINKLNELKQLASVKK